MRRDIRRSRISGGKEEAGGEEEPNHVFGSSEQISSVAAKLGVELRQAGGGKPDTYPTC